MDEETLKSLNEVIEYLYRDEQRHFEEEGRPAVHIFRDIRRLANYAEDERDRKSTNI